MSPPMSEFRDLVELAKSKGRTEWLPTALLAGIKTPPDAVEAGVDWDAKSWNHAWSRLPRTVPESSVVGDLDLCPTSTRDDLPVTYSYKKASFKRALEVTETADGRAAALSALDNDVYANSTKKPRDAVWSTWQQLCKAWGLPHLPVTEINVRCVGASLKQGAYSSAANVYAVAKVEHIRQLGYVVSPTAELMIKDCVRSITRGLCRSRAKVTFFLEDIPLLEWPQKPHLMSPPAPNSVAAGWNIQNLVVIGTWFMFRGIEVANARLCDLQLQGPRQTKCEHHKNLRCSIFFKVSKVDSAGDGVTRVLGCCCQDDDHSGLCPVAAAIELLEWHKSKESSQQSPLFPSSSGLVLTKHELVGLMEQVRTAVGYHLSDPTEGKPSQVAQEHLLRTAGAQYLARQCVEISVIKLAGRWKSNAVEKYIQDAPLLMMSKVFSLKRSLPPGAPSCLDPTNPCSQSEVGGLGDTTGLLSCAALHSAIEQLTVDLPRGKPSLDPAIKDIDAVRNEASACLHLWKEVTDGSCDKSTTRCGWCPSPLRSLEGKLSQLVGWRCPRCFKDAALSLQEEVDEVSDTDGESDVEE